jgi:membrane-bound inhibitor of C-type lysozyme
MKKILLLFLFITALTNAQTISIVSIPTEVKQGDTFDVTFEYTATVDGMYELQFIPMGDDGQPVWSQPNVAFLNGPISVNATATPITVSISLPNDIALPGDLPSPAVGWGLFGKITDGSADVAYLSPYPAVNVVANSGTGEVSTGTISVTSFPTEVARGSTFSATFEYTANFVGTYELQFIPMGTDGQPVWSLGNKAFVSNPIAVNESATSVTVDITIPDDIALSSELESPAVAWGLFAKIADSNGDVAYAAPYPQTTVSAVLSTKDIVFDTKTLFYNSNTKSLEINTNKINAKSLQIYNIRGQLVMNVKDASKTSSLDVSSLTSGVYFVRSKSKYLKFLK